MLAQNGAELGINDEIVVGRNGAEVVVGRNCDEVVVIVGAEAVLVKKGTEGVVVVGNGDVEAEMDVRIGAGLAVVKLDVLVWCVMAVAACPSGLQSLKHTAKPTLG